MNILIFGKDGQLGKAFKAVFEASKVGELHRIIYVGRTECDLSNADGITALLDKLKPNWLPLAKWHWLVRHTDQQWL